MYKLLCFFALIACALAAPKPGALLAPVAAPIVTATSSQVIARNYNAALVAPAVAVAAPVVKAAPIVAAAPALSYTAYPYSAYPYAAYPYII